MIKREFLCSVENYGIQLTVQWYGDLPRSRRPSTSNTDENLKEKWKQWYSKITSLREIASEHCIWNRSAYCGDNFGYGTCCVPVHLKRISRKNHIKRMLLKTWFLKRIITRPSWKRWDVGPYVSHRDKLTIVRVTLLGKAKAEKAEFNERTSGAYLRMGETLTVVYCFRWISFSRR